LLGRGREVDETRALLQGNVRLVTLTGPGGAGKTRLSVEVAAELLDDFADGVFLVELARISDPALVPSSIAQALGIREAGARPVLEHLKAHLRSRSLLLVLDNFEQVLPAAPVVADLLATCAGLKILVTSREPLRLRGEREYAVPPLALPDPHNLPPAELLRSYAAVALFVERATAIRADFAMTDENASAIVEICARLDGLPLAIELAAARVRLLTPQTIVERLNQRLPLLTGGQKDAPARQRTLRNTIAWSHDLLDEHERRLFRHLSAFVGGWTVEAAEAVCDLGDPGCRYIALLDGLESLSAKSLIQVAESSEGAPRFSMLETIREYALERLDESDDGAHVRRRHAQFFLAVAERAEPELRRAAQGVWLNRLEADHDNFRLVLRWVVERNEAELALRLGGALSHFWEMRGHQTEGRARLAEVLLLVGTRKYPRLRAKMLCELGFLTDDQGDYGEARALQAESLAIRRELGDQRGVARCLIGLGWIASNEGDYATGRALHEECLAIMREVGDRRGIAQALGGLGHVAYVQGDHTEARAYHEESLSIAREVGDQRSVARSLTNLGWLAIERRDHTGAREWLAEGLAISYELGDARQLIDGLETFVCLALALSDMEQAARLQGAAEAIRDTIGAPLSPSERTFYDVEVAAVRAALGEVTFAAAWGAGRAMTLEQAVAYALDAVGSA
jgi:predicted ATPase